jgi:type VI secretion system protein ImpH
MAAENRENSTRLIRDLEEHAPEYSVFQAIFLAEMLSKKAHPDRDDAQLDQEGLHFRPHEYYVFPPKDIRSFSYDRGILSFVLNFLGLYGVDSPLPRCYHEQVAAQQSVYGPGHVPLQNFLDIFNTRFYWLYFQAWKKYRYYLQLSDDARNRIIQRLFAFIGQPESFFSKHKQISRFKWLRLSSILSNRVRNTAGLQILLREFFPKHQFRIEEFVPHRVRMTESLKLGRDQGGMAYQLSGPSFLGRSMVDYMGRIRVEIGPLDFEDYLEFTPGTENAILLKDLISLYVNDGLEYDTRFVIKSETIERVSWKDKRLKLGVSQWLGRPKQKVVEVDFSYERFSGATQ